MSDLAVTDRASCAQRFIARSTVRVIAGLLLALLSVLGSAKTATVQRFEIGLVTIGPGPIYWQRFGHNAILVKDAKHDRATLYSYGFFDFEQKDFFWRFLKGQMRYEMDGLPADLDLRRYVKEGRSIRLQMLEFNAEQAAETARFLEWNRDPKHREYDYDYFLSNCSTKVRDLLDRVLGGALKRELVGRSNGMSYRMHTLRSLFDNVPMWAALHIGLGERADPALSMWDEAFLPDRLSVSLRDVQLSNAEGQLQSLVRSERELVAGKFAPPPEYSPSRLWQALLLGIAGALLLALAQIKSGNAWWLRAMSLLWVSSIAIAGLIVVALGLLTAHTMAWPNENILVLNPLGLLAFLWRGAAIKRRLWQLFGTLAVLAVLIQWLPAFSQANGEILGLAVPLNLALAWAGSRYFSGSPMRPVT